MCQDCGCATVSTVAIDGVPHSIQGHTHDHPHHHHRHLHPVAQAEASPSAVESLRRTLTVENSLLAKNDHLAQHNREEFQARGLRVFNLLSSPGAGKTALLERMIRDLRDRPTPVSVGVIVGDLETDNDAQRLRHAGAPAIQITTGNACHLDAAMIARAMSSLDLNSLGLLVIENVGNLVCPAAYDLGESGRVVLLSVTEGEDKPLKYPTMFKTAQMVLITKMDIAEAVGFDRERAIANLQRVAPQATVFEVSSRTGQGMDAWYRHWLP